MLVMYLMSIDLLVLLLFVKVVMCLVGMLRDMFVSVWMGLKDLLMCSSCSSGFIVWMIGLIVLFMF